MATAALVTLRGIPSIPKLGDDGDDVDPTMVDRTPPPPPAPVRTPRRATLSSVPPRRSDVRALAPTAEKRAVPRPAAKLTPSAPPPAALNVRAPMSSCPTEPIDPACIEEVLARVAAPPPLPSSRPPAPSIDMVATFDTRPRALVVALTVVWFVRFAALAAFHRTVTLARVVFTDAKEGSRAAWDAGRAKAAQR